MIFKNIKDIELTQKKPADDVEIKRDIKGNADKIPWDLYVDDIFVKRYYYKSPCYQGGPYGSMRVEEEFIPDDAIPNPTPTPDSPEQYYLFDREWIMQNIITDNAIQKDQILIANVDSNVLDFSKTGTKNFYLNPAIFCNYTADKPNEVRATSKK